MTEIVDEKNTIKLKKEGRKWKTDLTNLWQTESEFKHVDDEVLNAVIKKTTGNPLLCLNYFVNMMHNGFLKIDTKKCNLKPTD